MKVQPIPGMRQAPVSLFIFLALLLGNAALRAADPQVDSWLTTYAGRYARVYTNDTMKANGTTVTTWANNLVSQNTPAYCGVQQVLSSSNWVYVRSTGLGSHIMGPWWNNAAHTTVFPNLPANQKMIARIPRTPVVSATKSQVHGECGFSVDGVRIFDAGDAFSYSNSNGQDASAGNNLGQGDGVWNREALSNEGLTMDPAYAHQQNTGVYHYHASSIALRYLLGDNVTFNSTTKAYSESTNAPTKHSPIIGWIYDGYPLYGPYGYANATNANSGVRRMVSGYVSRDGTAGSVNLTNSGRQTLPAWASRLGRSTNLTSGQYGPNVSTTYPIGHYIEDYEYLGDLGKVQGTDFDLDEYNGRWCVTPEFPNGTYAYFQTISSNGTPIYPYNTGRLYYGTQSGGVVTSIAETVTTNVVAGPDAQPAVKSLAIGNNTVTLVWDATEGGTYSVESSTTLTNWTTKATNVAASLNSGQTNFSSGGNLEFYRVTRTALASYDSVTGTGGTSGNGITSVSPVSGNRGTTLTLTINLDPSVNPPPQTAPVISVTVGTITGTSNVHVSQTQVTSSITIPANAATGAQTVTVVFPGPPGSGTTVTYTRSNAFTIQ